MERPGYRLCGLLILLSLGLTVVMPCSSADNGYLTDVHSKYIVTFNIPDVANCDHYLIDFGDGSTLDSTVDDVSGVESTYDTDNGTWTYIVVHTYPEVPGTYTMEFTAFNSEGDSATSGLNVTLMGYPVITFVSNGGSAVAELIVENGPSHGGSAADSYYTKANEPDEPIRDGFLFNGWYTDSGLAHAWDWDALVTGSMTLYAGWDPVSDDIVITFYVDRVPYHEETYSSGEIIVLPAEPHKDGYVFKGWKGYTDGMTASVSRGFCAQWESVEPVSYHVSYSIDGRVYNSYIPAEGGTLPEPSKDGCSFQGWYLDEDLTIPFEPSMLNSDMVLYPKFSEEEKGSDVPLIASVTASVIGILGLAIGFRSGSRLMMATGAVILVIGVGIYGAGTMGWL